MISVLRRSPSRYIPLLISMCGYSMSDVTNDGRMLILNRLWNAILENGIFAHLIPSKFGTIQEEKLLKSI